MISPFGHGFLLGFSLIFVIGAQNIFVLRQGLIRRHVLAVVIFCSFSDMALIIIGVLGTSHFMPNNVVWLKPYLFLFASIWLFLYGCLRMRSSFSKSIEINIDQEQRRAFWTTMATVFIITFGNPHVYLDTVFLLGTISLQYDGTSKISYALGASLASFIFFFVLGYSSRILLPIMINPKAWRVFDFFVALIMFFLAISMLRSGDFLS